MKRPLLVAGIGNIFFGADAFGSVVARELMKQHWPEGVRVDDFGLRNYDLAYALMDGCDAILLDLVSRGEPPGTLCLLEVDLENLDALQTAIPDAPGLTPVGVLELVRPLGGRPTDGDSGRLFLLGCEPGTFDSADADMDLSPAVTTAVPYAIARVESLIADFLYDQIPVCSGLAGMAKNVS